MQKQAPSLGRVLTMVLFALSCFGLLLFLWLSFGGPIPLKPKGYQFKVAFPEATQLGLEADVRVAGVSIGKVRDKTIDPAHPNRTVATIEVTRKYAPIAKDARAILRQKTLLGETYVEMTPGNKRAAGTVPDGGFLGDARVTKTVELDEIFQALDPKTRKSFQTWQQDLSKAVAGRGRDLNDALGNLPAFADDANDLLTVLDGQAEQVSSLVRGTGQVFGALTQDEGQLHNLIVNAGDTFDATSSQQEALAQTFRIFPTFLDESKATFRRLDRFSANARPLLHDLRPAFRDLGPTLRSVGDLSPDLKRLFVNLDPLLDQSRTSLPAQRQIFQGLRPVVGSLGPWLSELNPILAWLGEQNHTVTDIMANLGVATSARTKSSDPRSPGHYLRQYGPSGAETVAVHPERLSSNRGNTYVNPLEATSAISEAAFKSGILPSFDCRNAGGDKPATDGPQGSPPCRTQKAYGFQGRLTRFPHVEREDYSK